MNDSGVEGEEGVGMVVESLLGVVPTFDFRSGEFRKDVVAEDEADAEADADAEEADDDEDV
jgi:hypothetical protein